MGPGAKGHDAPVLIASLPWQDAFLLAGSLRSSGIEVFLDPPDPPSTYTYGDMFRRPYHVLVRADDVEEARAIAAEIGAE
jgi:hypothetical protein